MDKVKKLANETFFTEDQIASSLAFQGLSLDLQFFADEGEQTTGDQTPNNSGGQEPPSNTEQTQQPGTGDQAPPEDKTFTQDDVNKIATKESRKATEKLLKDLGIDNFENAKEGMEKFKEWQESQQTEQEKQEKAFKELETNNNTLSEENGDLKAQLSALRAGVKGDSVEDVVALANRLVDEDTDINAAITKVVEKYPQFSQEQPKDENEDKPTFSTGQHQKQQQTELDKWMSAFK